MKIRENHHIIIEKYPYAESLNKKLLDDVKRFPFFNYENSKSYTNIHGSKCVIGDHQVTLNMQLIVDWVKQLILAKKESSNLLQAAAEHKSKIDIGIWFAKYNKGEYTINHDHTNHALHSFVYFVECPKGSSPLVFTTSRKRINAEEGKIVIFPGNVYHHVPKNKCDGRMTLVGNVGMVEST